MRASIRSFHADAMRGWCITLVLGAVLSLSLPSPALAHRFRHPKTLRLGVSGAKLLLEIQWDAQPGKEARRTRQLFDRNTDGVLDEREVALAMEAFERRQWTWLSIKTSAGLVRWKRLESKPVGHRLPADSGRSLGIRLLYVATVTSSKTQSLTVYDRSADASDHVPLAVNAEPPWTIQAASQGHSSSSGRQLSDVRLSPKRALTMRLSPSS